MIIELQIVTEVSMIKKKEERRGPIEIDLTGPDGNVFVLMQYARKFAKQIYDSQEEELIKLKGDIEAMLEIGLPVGEVPRNMGDVICEQMMESDYENAIQVFDKYFGVIVTLLR